MARKRPQMPVCSAMIGCDGDTYIRVEGDLYCGRCKAELAKRTKQNNKLKGEHFMEYAIARGKEKVDG